ncbi:unnamed protein product [Gadus morhua 'NCC']
MDGVVGDCSELALAKCGAVIWGKAHVQPPRRRPGDQSISECGAVSLRGEHSPVKPTLGSAAALVIGRALGAVHWAFAGCRREHSSRCERRHPVFHTHADNRRRALFPTLNTLPSNPLLCTSDSAGAAHRSPFITDLILPAGTAAAVTRLVTTAQKNRSLVLGQSQHNKQPSFPGMSAVLSIGDKGREKENVFPPADALPEIRPVGHLADPDEVVPSLGEERRADGRGGGQLSVCPSLTGRWQRYCGGWRGPPCRRVSPGFGSRSRQGDRRRWRTKVEAAPKAGLGSGGVDRRLI